ncbi:hypothetical protein AMJ80_01655 [bacterium SM23_31]|nr:MAG: hypothetical protein AMJ80_01655 [bacterium SM23_31]
MRKEYQFDYKKSKPNRFAAEMGTDTIAVILDPDVASVFKSAKSINNLLRSVTASLPVEAEKNFDYNEFISDLFRALLNLPGSTVKKLVTKTKNKTNLVKIEDNKIFVATEKDFDEFKEIPDHCLKTTFNELLDGMWLTQNRLKKELNVKRSAFIFTAFDLLPYITYNHDLNAIKMEKG